MMNDQKRAALLQIKQQTDIKADIPGLKMPLEPHQRVGVSFAVLAKRSLNLDFLGAGKTVTSVATDLKLRQMGQVERTLVICQGGKRWDWQYEYSRFTDIPTYLIDGNKQQRINSWMEAQSAGGVTIAHYNSVRGDFLTTEKVETGRFRQGKKEFHTVYQPASLLSMLRFDHIIIDEVTVFKSWDTALIRSLWALVTQTHPEFMLGLSATPIQKSLEDLHSIMSVIYPGLLGHREEFEQEYCIKKLFSTYGKGNRKHKFLKIVGFKNEDKLANIMAPYYLRREKEQVYSGRLKHIPKIRRVLLGKEQMDAYNKLQQQVDRGDSRGALLQVFLEMEKTCDTMTWYPGGTDSAKVDDIISLLQGDLKEEKVVVFSKHKQPLRHLALRMNEIGVKHITYSGDVVDIKEREKLRREFQEDPAVQVALVTTAAEMGFDFHAAHYMIFINHIYNPARIDQIRGRIDRPIVQKSSFICTIHYVCEGTFEENVIPRLHREADLMTKVFGAANSFDPLKSELIDALSNDQLFDLIKTGRLRVQQEGFDVSNQKRVPG